MHPWWFVDAINFRYWEHVVELGIGRDKEAEIIHWITEESESVKHWIDQLGFRWN